MDSKERSIFELISKRFTPDGIIVDIGGFSGEWTRAAMEISRKEKFYIFEPNAENYQRIKEKFKDFPGVLVVNKGLGDIDSKRTYFSISGTDNERGMSGFVKREVYSLFPYEEKEFQISTFDKEIPEGIFLDFVKIDVEGYELNVLKGMVDSLKKRRVNFIQFEYGGTYPDANICLNDIISFFSDFGYYVYDLKNGVFERMEIFEDDFTYNNFLATNQIL